MKSTYLNDNMSSVYPFASNEVLPIARSCISSLGVCVYVRMAAEGTGRITSVYVSNITVADDVVSLSMRTDTDVSLGVLKIERAGGTAAIHTDCITGHMYGSTGIIDDRSIGAYSGHWELDSDCVNIVNIPSDAYDMTIQSVGANTSRRETQHTLSINILGDVYVTLSDSANNNVNSTALEGAEHVQLYANIEGRPSDGATYIKPKKQSTMKFVSAINTILVPALKDDNTLLETSTVLEIVSKSEHIALSLQDAANNDGAIVCINGNGKFPSCYGDEDESSITDEEDWEQ